MATALATEQAGSGDRASVYPDAHNQHAVVAVYNTHQEAETAVRELQRAGVDMKKLSVIGKGYHTEEDVVGYYNVGDRMKHWGKWGALWGGLWGGLFAAGVFFVPVIGPVLVAGPLVMWIVGALEGAVVVGGLGAIGGGLAGVGIPNDSILKYETALKADKFLVIAHGTTAEVERAREIIGTTGAAEAAVHHAAAV